MFEIAAVAGPNTSANKSGKWRQGKSESWPLFGGDSTFFFSSSSSLVVQKKQPRKRGKAAAAALATTECRVVDVWSRGLLLLRSARARKDNLIHSIVTNVVSRISEVSFESTLHNLLIPNFQLKSQGYLNN